MAKKKVESEQPKVAVAEGGSQSEDREKKIGEQKAPRSGIVTTEGNRLDRIRIFQKDGVTKVQAEYGKLNASGKTTEERRANMRLQYSRPLTAEQSVEYQRLSKENPDKAKEYAVRAAYPMHADDAAFHQKDTEINGRHVNYITLEKITEGTLLLNALRKGGVDVDHMDKDQRASLVASMSPEDKENALSGKEGLIGKWQLSFGEKDNKESRFQGILNKEDLASIRNRAEVTLDDKGQVAKVGKPLSMADIAGRVEQRVNAKRQATAAKMESAQKVDWSQFKFPEGVKVTGLHYSPTKNKPDQVWLNGNVNGIKVFGLLSKEETTAVKNKFATLEQVGAANQDFSQKVRDIVNNNKSVGVTEDAAVKAIIDRASDKNAKSFTPEQRDVLMKFAGSADTPEAREKVFDGLWEKAETALKDAGVNEAWQKDAHEELKDLAQGAIREEGQGLKR